jgi:signal transduction histidine kinase/DNA-binding response OmpR family regulator
VNQEHRATILVVDDLPAQRISIECALTELGERVVTVGSGREALRYLLEQDAAVILLDVNMPDMDGFETAALIRQRPRTRHTPIIFLTANTDEVAAARAYSLGAVDYIFSPFPANVLRAKVRVFVELSKMHERTKREAEQAIALSRAQTARAAAEEDRGRFRVLAEASAILSRSLDSASLVADLLGLCVPLMADLAAVRLSDADGAETSWLDVPALGRVSRDPMTDADGLALAPRLERVTRGGQAETLKAPDGRITGVVLPLVARGRTLGALAAVFVRSSRHYRDADLDLIRDIAGRAAIALDNSRLYREIHARDRQKDEFLAMLSHELRNPLGAITTAARLLDLVDGTDAQAQRAREIIQRQTGHLTRIVDDLLDVARLTAGQMVLTRAPLDVADVVERAIEALRVAGRLEHHHLTAKLESLIVEADGARLEQVVANLLVNAVKYTNQGGSIDVQVYAAGDEAVVRVSDTGVGISAEMLPRLFDLFTQGRQTLDRAQGGLGIGLTLVRRLVGLHGGRVEAASDGPGRGSTFTVTLPRAVNVSGTAVPAVGEADHFLPLRILVVEDNGDAREMLRTVLELAGHKVHEAADGLRALQIAAETKPQLALIDIGLPGLDGLEVAKRLRASPAGEKMLLVAVTGYGQGLDRRQTSHAGFDLHLTKPVDAERLNEILAVAARRCTQGSPSEGSGVV